MDKELKNQIIETYARHEGDAGSPEVQIALLTERINHPVSYTHLCLRPWKPSTTLKLRKCR